MPKNRILRSLSSDELARLQPHLAVVDLGLSDVLHEAGAPIESVYLPESGLVSLLHVSESGDAIETGVVGTEGIVGGLTLLDARRSISQATVQISGRAYKLSTPSFLQACAAIPRLKGLTHQHLQILLFQAQQNAACHALHTVEGRLCRWMLLAQDATKSDVLDLTQEFLSQMLGAQRTSVSMIAHNLQQAGIIRYRRGRIEVIDKIGLEAAACECYSLIKHEIDSTLPEPGRNSRNAGTVQSGRFWRAS